MLSGSCPRGSSRTPGSGKIGRVSHSATAPERSLIRSLPYENISEDSRRRPLKVSGSVPPMASKNLTSCLRAAWSFHCAIAPEQRQQLVDRGLPLAAAEQRRRQFEARLVIIRVLRQPRAQLAGGRHRPAALLGEVERGARGGDLGVAGAFPGNAVEHLARLGQIALGDHRPDQAGLRLDIVGLALQDLRIDRAGAGMVAGLQGLLGHRHRLLDRRGTAGLAGADPLRRTA